MDRRTFMKKIGELAGVSAAGITLSKLQIATIATGLSSLFGCSGELTEDPNDENVLLAPSQCDVTYVCRNPQNFNCSSEFSCSDFECGVPGKFMCNRIFNCELGSTFSCSPVDYVIHQQGTSATVDS